MSQGRGHPKHVLQRIRLNKALETCVPRLCKNVMQFVNDDMSEASNDLIWDLVERLEKAENESRRTKAFREKVTPTFDLKEEN